MVIKLSMPAKRVKLSVIEKKKADKVCLNFRNRTPGEVGLPLVERGVTIGVGGVSAITSVQTTLGVISGLNCTKPELNQIQIVLPCSATMVELMLSYEPRGIVPQIIPPSVRAINSQGEQVSVKQMLNPAGQPEIIRFEGRDLKKLTINSVNTLTYLYDFCFFCPDTSPSVTAAGVNYDTGTIFGPFANQGNVIEVSGQRIGQVILNSQGDICLLKICALFGPDPAELNRRQEMARHLENEVARWETEGEVLEPFSAYRLTIKTAIDAYGVGELSGERHLSHTEYAYFRTEGPPGLTRLSLPAGLDPATDAVKFESGLEDLTRYVRQTIPVAIPAVGEKPVMAKPFYRAYDIAVDFNEDYVDLMYRISGRDLSLYLFDNNSRPVRDAEGRLLAQSGEWGSVEELTLTEGEQRWVALLNTADCDLPVLAQENIVRDKKLSSAIAGRVLAPDTIYEARLIPLLLREGFRGYALGDVAQQSPGILRRWQVRDEGNINTPSKWEVGETGTPPGRYVIQTSSIKGDNDNPAKPGTMLLFGNDPSLETGHQDQPPNWTDYRLSVYLRSSGEGATGVVFRFLASDNYYRLSLDRRHGYRRLVRVANGDHVILKEDDFVYESETDYLITVEVIGSGLRVYQDGALVFDVTDAAHAQGGIGLYCHDNPGARYSDVKVDDFRQTAHAVYRYQFTTSLFANFFHHLHSYQDETWIAASQETENISNALGRGVNPPTPMTDDEARAYETLATAALGLAAKQNPREVQVTRFEIDGSPLAFLIQSPEPIDWLRTNIFLSENSLILEGMNLPGKVKLAAVTFAANEINVESVTLLLRESLNLSGYRIESRPVKWQLNLNVDGETGIETVLINRLEALPDPITIDTEWELFYSFEAERDLSDGTVLTITPGSETPVSTESATIANEPGSVDSTVSLTRPAQFVTGVELRIVAPGGDVIHSRYFLSEDNYPRKDVLVLRKADGTGFFIIKPGSIPFTPGQYRLTLHYRRDNRDFASGSPVYSEAGNTTDEVGALDIPWQTH
jgi:hypothetical protein